MLEEPHRECPFCTGMIKENAVECEHCGKMLDASNNKVSLNRRDFNKARIVQWIFVIAAIFGIIAVVFRYIDVSSENARLKNRVAVLESKGRELNLELEGLKSSYDSLLFFLIKEGKFGIDELAPLLAPQEIQKVKDYTVLRGKITFPDNESIVSRAINVRGETQGVPSDFHVWLMVEISSLRWPKEPQIHINSPFQTIVHEGGYPPEGQFTLSLYAIGPKGNKCIKAWFNEGRRTGSFPGLTTISESFLLDSVSLRLH